MNTLSDIEDCQLDAKRLREAREGRGLTVSEAARQVTLSRAQVDQIENGGCSAFYSPQHKVLAVRKYASALGLDPEEILAGAPEAAPDPDPALDPDLAPTLAEAPVSDAEAGDQPLPVPSLQLASVAPPAQTDEVIAPADTRHGDLLTMQPVHSVAPVIPQPAVMMRSLMPGLLAAGAAAIVFAILRGPVGSATTGSVEEAVVPTEPVAVVEPLNAPVALPVSAPPAVVAQAEPAQLEASLSDPGAASGCGAAPDLPQWTPPYVRKASTRLYVGGPAGTRVCVSDSAGKVSQLVLDDGPMQSVNGRPPFVVHSSGLGSLTMFMQGMKVKVPLQASAIRLLPGEQINGPAELAADATPES